MTRIEAAISGFAARWLEARQRARNEGGGPVYWLFGYLGFAMAALLMVEVVQKHAWLRFPMDFVLPGFVALLWVRSARYRLRPFKMFGLTFLALIFLSGVL